jgi:hypothetical protein
MAEMTIELYRQQPMIEATKYVLDDTKAAQRAQWRQDLGLTGQLALQRHKDLAPWYPHLSLEEWEVWRKFLPKDYHHAILPNRTLEYTFDIIPDEVLEEWVFVQRMGWFRMYAIRTPEQATHLDPALFGWVDEHYMGSRGTPMARPYLIARWGESLLSFEDIKALVNSRRNDVVVQSSVKGRWTHLQKLFTTGL